MFAGTTSYVYEEVPVGAKLFMAIVSLLHTLSNNPLHAHSSGTTSLKYQSNGGEALSQNGRAASFKPRGICMHILLLKIFPKSALSGLKVLCWDGAELVNASSLSDKVWRFPPFDPFILLSLVVLHFAVLISICAGVSQSQSKPCPNLQTPTTRTPYN